MKKLNRKGYMTVEIIIASVIAFSIAFFLMEITIKLVDISDNEYVNTNFMTDKALIMKNIKENIQNDIESCGKISYIDFDEQYELFSGYGGQWLIVFENGKQSVLSVEKGNNNDIIVTYFNTNNESYSKTFGNGLKNVEVNYDIYDNYIYFRIKGDNIFSDEIYDINIVVYNG